MSVRGKQMYYLWHLLTLCWAIGLAICEMSTGEPPTSTWPPTERPETSSPKTTTASVVTTNTTDKPFVTMSPPKQVKYKMTLTNTGLAVLDSTITFNATLIPDTNATIDPWPVEFIYQWMNMATMDMDKTYGGVTSVITKAFPSIMESEGDYTMTVAAFLKEDPSKMVAFQTRKFTLTENLNGHLLLKQDLEYQRFPNVLSTDLPVTLMADVNDHFSEETRPDFEYYWYENETFLSDTFEPNYTWPNPQASNVTLKSIIIASFAFNKGFTTGHHLAIPDVSNTADLDSNDNSHATSGNDVKKSVDEQPGLNRHARQKMVTDPLPFTKKGNFEKPVIFKEPIKFCYLMRVDSDPDDRGIEMGSAAVINITCSGSTPSSVCVNITAQNSSIPVNETCKPEVFNDTLRHQVKIKLNSTGWNYVHFYVFSDVSRLHLNQSYYGYNSDEVNVPALILPVVFGVLGIFIVLGGIAYIMRLRKKPLVEVADFDFHPTLTSSTRSETSVRFSRMVNALKLMFFRDRYATTHNDPQQCKAATPLSTSDTDSKQFYNSL